MTRILVVDDEMQMRRALRHALAARGYEVMLAATGEEGLDLAASLPPDLVILDLALPGLEGLEVCRELRTFTQVPIVVLSVREGSADKVAALDLGADDYLTKPFDTAELLARIRSHLRRATLAQPTGPTICAGALCLDLERHQAWLDGEEVHLTRTEFALLGYLVGHAGRVVTHGLLLDRVWGGEHGADVSTLRVHMANLRRKIEPDPDRPTLITTEPGVGYRFSLVP
ncbi:MAG: response regulator transcription factor [Armatimonadetes bacterium]|nr:response regulator transcription factor [Armatimonadota bacterium]